MSITDRMENDGLSFQDAKMKESLAVGEAPPFSIAARLRMKGCSDIFEQSLMNEAADLIEQQDKRFTEYLETWRANNAHHAQRIAELERGATLLLAQWHAERNKWMNKPPCICSACETAKTL